jgi:hypothetical protein
MGNLLPVNEWVDVPYFETNAVLTGGPDCPDNIPIQALLNRTEWLKNQVDKTMPSLRANDALPVLDIGVIWHDSYGLMAWSAAAAMYKQVRTATAGGTANAITADIYPQPLNLDALNGLVIHVRAAAANTDAATLKIGALAAVAIVKGANAVLVPGDIAGAGHWLTLQYDKTLNKFVLLNPATGISSGFPEVSSVPAQKIAPLIIVTQPHTRMMIWSGAQYVRAPWHQPCQLFYSYDNPASISGALPVRADVSYQQSNYPDVVARLGLSGSGTFSLVEARGEFLRVLDNGRDVDPWRQVGSAQAMQTQAHKHIYAMGETYPGALFGRSTTKNYRGTSGGTDFDNFLEFTNDGTTYNDTSPNSNGVIGEENRPRNVAFPLWMTI